MLELILRSAPDAIGRRNETQLERTPISVQSARLNDLTPSEARSADQEFSDVSAIMHTAPTADLAIDDVINLVPDDGRRWDVLAVRTPSIAEFVIADLRQQQRGAGA